MGFEKEPINWLHLGDAIKITAEKVMLPPDTVKAVVFAFLDTLKKGLIDEKRVWLRDFFTLWTKKVPAIRNFPDTVRLRFRIAPNFRKQLKENQL